MSFFMRILVRIIANAIAIWVAAKLIPGFEFVGNWQDFIIAGIVLGIVNSLIKPVIKLISLPIILLTLGLFTIIINTGLLILVARILPTMQIHSFWAAFWGVIIISLVNHILTDGRNKIHNNAKNN